jgi:hypothetical protein
MIVKGSARGKPLDLAKHVLKEENEAVRLIHSEGVLADDIEGAIVEMDAQGAALRTRRTLYHASINPEPGKDRDMTDAERDYAVATFRKKMGFENQPYIVIEHEKYGKDGVLRRHWHIVTALADVEHMRAVRTDHNYRKHEEIAREIERHLGHEKVQGAHVDRDGERPDRTPTHAEMQQAERGAVSAKEAKALGAELWAATDSGKALKAGLEAQGWIVARGDQPRADGGAYFMAIDPQCGTHELRRMVPVKAAALYARMAEIDPASLPSVKAAKTVQMERAAARVTIQREKLGGAAVAAGQANGRTGGAENGREGHRPAKQPTTAEHMRAAWTAAKDAGDLIAGLAARNIRLARVTPGEARFNQEQRAVAKQLGRVVRPMRDGEIVAVDGRGHVYRFEKRTTGAARGDIQKRLAGVDAGFLPGVTATKDAIRQETRAAWIEARRIERQKARPVSKIEYTILHAVKAASGDRAKFAAELHQQGIAVVRVTAADVQALDQLRKDDELDRVTAAANDAPYRQAPILADVLEGELAAVLKSGAVLKLNQQHMAALAAVGIAVSERQPVKGPNMQTPEPTPAPPEQSATPRVDDVGNNPAAAGTPLQAATEARADFQTERTEAAQFQQGMIDIQLERRDEATRARVLASENRDAEQADRIADAALADKVYEFADTVEATVDMAARAGSGVLAGIASWFEGIFARLGDVVAPPPKMTAQQVHDTLQANVGNLEKDHALAVAADVQQTEAAREWQALSLTSAQQEKDLRLYQELGTGQTAEANLTERDRSRDL